MKRRHYGSKKLTRAQKAVVPSMMDAIVRAEAKPIAEIEAEMKAREAGR